MLCTHSELRRALSHDVDSAIGFDRFAYSLIKVNFSWQQKPILNFCNVVFRGAPSGLQAVREKERDLFPADNP